MTLGQVLLTGFVSAVVAGITIGLLVWAIQRYVQTKRLFGTTLWWTPRRLRIQDVMPLRGDPRLGFKDYYYSRTQDEEILESLSSGNDLLITGDALCGKTRALFEAVKKLPRSYRVLLMREVEFGLVAIRLPWNPFKYWTKELIILDDLHRLVALPNFALLLHRFRERGAILAATCRSGTQGEIDVKSRAPDIFGLFRRHVQVVPIDRETAQYVAQAAGVPLPRYFFGPIGSIFLSVERVLAHLDACSTAERNLLRAMAEIHLAGASSSQEGIPTALVARACGITNFRKAPHEWSQLLELLVTKGLLRIAKGKLQCEETFLEHIVAERQESLRTRADVWDCLEGYPQPRLKVALAAIADASNSRVAQEWFDKLCSTGIRASAGLD